MLDNKLLLALPKDSGLEARFLFLREQSCIEKPGSPNPEICSFENESVGARSDINSHGKTPSEAICALYNVRFIYKLPILLLLPSLEAIAQEL